MYKIIDEIAILGRISPKRLSILSRTMPKNSLSSTASSNPARRLRLAYFVSHPIQYQAPLLRRIASEPDFDFKVFFSSDVSVREYIDPGFGVKVKWDVPLLAGYEYEFLPRLRDSKQLGFMRPLSRGIYKRLREGRFDAAWVHGYATANALQAILAARALGIPVLIRSDSTLFDRARPMQTKLAKALFFRMIKSSISAALTVGAANAEYWRYYLGEGAPIFPLSYAVDNDFFQRRCREASVNRESFRRHLGLEPGRPVILFASKLQKRKRCEDLLEAFLKLQTPNDKPRPYLLIIGDGEERAALEERSRCARPDDVRFLGFRNQTALPEFYDLCDVFVLVSVDEPWGLVINEVMNAARAIIVSDEVGCQRDLVEDGVNGHVVRARDVAGLANCLGQILSDPQKCAGMGLRSLERIQKFSFEHNVSELRRALFAIVPRFAECQNSENSSV